jgi:hypothetical protein
MRLIFPMDIAYATIYLLYNVFIIILRSYKDELSTANYVFYYNCINMVKLFELCLTKLLFFFVKPSI